MKIAQIAPPWISVSSKNSVGTEAVISYLVEEQVAQGHDVTLFAPGDAHTSARLVSFFPTSLTDQGIPWSAHSKAYYHLYKALQYAEDFDIVHAHLSSTTDMYLFPLLASLSTPHVTTLHNHFPFDRVDTWTGDADTYFLEWMQHAPVVTVSEAARVSLPYDLNCLDVVHQGIPMQSYPFSRGKREDFFVWLGRCIPERGPHLAIQAARSANVPLVLASVLDEQLPEAAEYFAQEIQPWLDDKEVRYIGPVNFEEKVALLSQARGLLHPTIQQESAETSILEAMALGCRVISFTHGILPELIEHEKTGFLAQDLSEMITYIRRIDTLDRWEIRQHVEKHFSAQVMAQKYQDIYQGLLSS